MALARDEHEEAAGMLREGIGLCEQTKDGTGLAHFLDALAALASSRGEAERSAVLLGAAEVLLRGVGAPVLNHILDPILKERPTAETRAVLGEAAFEEARKRGQAMTFERAAAYALSETAALERPKP